ncbi:glycosyl hydrolase family 76-domain-containing protein [Phaeosphaeriaceae sp. PMI808]|nr:glycosyl hydrolase family 76-domain-containing protein [Phaeosphaeriaceae sp. PMI808]
MIGNLAQADPQNAGLQNLAWKMFEVASIYAPAKNPDPGREDPLDTVSSRSNSTHLELGYNKYLDPKTHEPRAVFPADWSNSQYPSVINLAIRFNRNEHLMGFDSNPSKWLDGYYDDDLWWALAWIKAYDVTQYRLYLTLAEGIFLAVTKVWPTHCGNGGIYWSYERNYVNAIPNELFMSTAAHLANRVSAEKKQTYVNWAQRTLTWFLGTGMLNDRGTINDGLDKNCKNNGNPTWSYNQGVILGALVELNIASPDVSYLALASRIVHAALRELSDANGVIHDVCEPNCGNDGAQFKGIFMRNLQALYAVAPHEELRLAVKVNAESVWASGREDNQRGVVFGVNWAGPFSGVDASTQSSAMEALIANIVVN